MPSPRDDVRFCRPPQLPGVEIVTASYSSRAFPTHSHEEYVIGVVTAGAEFLAIRGNERLVRPGDLILIEPDEAHSNRAVGGEGVTYRVFYVPAAVLGEVFGQVRFVQNVLSSKPLGDRLAKLHEQLADGDPDPQLEEQFVAILGDVIDVTGDSDPLESAQCADNVARARDYLDARYAEPVRLSDLAHVAGLSPYHLLRTFKQQVGITPGAYQIQLRVLEARRRLRQGAAIADTAADLGFADQSHFTRHFQRIIGTSPGRYVQQ